MGRGPSARAAAGIAAILAGEREAPRGPLFAVAEELLRAAPENLLSGNPEEAARVADAISRLVSAPGPVELSAGGEVLKRASRGFTGQTQAVRELLLKGWLAVNALARVAKAPDKVAALRREAKNHRAHLGASEERTAAAALNDAAMKRHGRTLGWHLGPNENHCPVCLRLAGKNYDALRPPEEGLPSSVHPGCDCSPGAAFPDAPTVWAAKAPKPQRRRFF